MRGRVTMVAAILASVTLISPPPARGLNNCSLCHVPIWASKIAFITCAMSVVVKIRRAPIRVTRLKCSPRSAIPR